MSISRCPTCDKTIDEDFDVEHYDECAAEEMADTIEEFKKKHLYSFEGLQMGTFIPLTMNFDKDDCIGILKLLKPIILPNKFVRFEPSITDRPDGTKEITEISIITTSFPEDTENSTLEK